MAKQRSDVSNYPSRYSPGGYVTVCQYIIELLCENRAKALKKDLPIKFWELPEWSNFYKSQLRVVHKLLKEYDSMSIIAVVKGSNIWSLRPSFVIKKIKDEERKRAAIEEQTKLAANEKSFLEKYSNITVENTGRREHRSQISDTLESLDE